MTNTATRLVLLVEDSLADARIFQTMLREYSYEYSMRHVERLSEALVQLTQGEFALVLLDLSLPDSKGLETISAVRKQVPHMPIIVLTGLDDEEMGIKALQEGAEDYLVKGQFTASAFMRAINYAIERHRLRENLLASEGRCRDLFENASDTIVSFTTDGIVTEVNRGLETLLGWSRQELVGQHYRQILTPESAMQWKSELLNFYMENVHRHAHQ